MASKINWHRYGTKLRHYHPIYSTKNLLKRLDSLLQLIRYAVEYFITATVEHYFRRGHTLFCGENFLIDLQSLRFIGSTYCMLFGVL